MQRIKIFAKSMQNLPIHHFIFRMFIFWVPFVLIFQFVFIYFQLSSKEFGAKMSLSSLFIASTVYAPLIETFIFQFIPLEFSRFIGFPRWLQYLIGTFIFAIPHIEQNPIPGTFAGVFSGSLLVLTYLIRRERSLEDACFTTCILHSINNGFIFALALVLEGLFG